MNRDAFLRALKAYAKDHGLRYEWDGRKGKGSHGRVYVGERYTTVPAEVPAGTRAAILRQLGIPKDAI